MFSMDSIIPIVALFSMYVLYCTISFFLCKVMYNCTVFNVSIVPTVALFSMYTIVQLHCFCPVYWILQVHCCRHTLFSMCRY